MFRQITCQHTDAIPHLGKSQIMALNGQTIRFSTTKPNVIIGPNGSGKSALMTALSLLTLTHMTGMSALDNAYINGRDSDAFWTELGNYATESLYLNGVEADTDFGAAAFFRPGHIPGNDHSVTAAMMCGYFDEAREYGQLTRNKSSGQAGQALLEAIVQVLTGETIPSYGFKNWRHGDKPVDPGWRADGYTRKTQLRVNALIERYARVPDAAVPVVLMDEPEQSLDLLAQTKLWHDIQATDPSKLQVIVATHSFIPVMFPERFHIIEAVPGYAEVVRSGYAKLAGNAVSLAA